MQQGGDTYVWDPVVRLFHWSLVILFALAYFTGEGDETLHAYSGYVILGLVLFRVVWGFIGAQHARFNDFIYGPRAVIAYFNGLLRGHPKHYVGHNPAGGLMVVVLLISLLAISWTGLKVYGIEGHGPLAGDFSLVAAEARADDDDDDADEEGARGFNEAAEEYWEDLHEATVNFTLVLVFIHIVAVVLSSFAHRENLIRAMITGRKPARIDERAEFRRNESSLGGSGDREMH